MAFSSQATDHLPGQQDVNGAGSDVFVYDRHSGRRRRPQPPRGIRQAIRHARSGSPRADETTTPRRDRAAGDLVFGVHRRRQHVRCSAWTGGLRPFPDRDLQGADGASGNPRLGRDGRRVAFASAAVDLVPGQQGPRHGEAQVVLHDGPTGTNLLASHPPGQPGGVGNRPSGYPNLSAARGHPLLLQSLASNLTGGDYDYVADPFSGGTDPLFRGWDVFVFGFNRAPMALAQAATLREDTSAVPARRPTSSPRPPPT